MTWGMTLKDYIKSLLRCGKGLDHADFQNLTTVYGIDKIKKLTDECREELKQDDSKPTKEREWTI